MEEENILTDQEKDMALSNVKIILQESNLYDVDVALNEDLDINRIDNQNYAVIQFIGVNTRVRSEKSAFKILGIFDTVDDAADHINILRKDSYESNFDTYIVELYKFITSYPLKNMDSEKYMHDVVLRHRLKLELDKELYDTRKRKLMTGSQTNYKKEKPANIPEFKDLNDTIINKELDKNKIFRDKTHENIARKLEKRKQMSEKNQLRLIKSSITIPDQNYIVLNIIEDPVNDDIFFNTEFVNNTNVLNNNDNNKIVNPRIIKIKGAFNKYEDAKAHCEKLKEHNDEKYYDLIIAEMYNWLDSLPNIQQIPKEYDDKELNRLTKTHDSETKLTQYYENLRKQNTISSQVTNTNITNNSLNNVISNSFQSQPYNPSSGSLTNIINDELNIDRTKYNSIPAFPPGSPPPPLASASASIPSNNNNQYISDDIMAQLNKLGINK